MTTVSLSLARLAGRTGRGVTVAVVDSGVHGGHPHVGVVQAAVSFDEEGRRTDGVGDRLGHGTAVAAAIREKAPDVTLVSARVFDRSLATTNRALVAAIRWAAENRATLINLSLGTTNGAHRDALAAAVADAAAMGALVVAAAPDGEVWLPGALDGVVAVELDWECPRDRCLVRREGSSVRARASGFPRPIAGVTPERNVRGASFAVANACGFLALAFDQGRGAPPADPWSILMASMGISV